MLEGGRGTWLSLHYLFESAAFFLLLFYYFFYYLNTTYYSEPVQNCNNNLFHIRVPAVCSAATLNSSNQHVGYLLGLDITKSRLHIYVHIDF